MKKNKNLPRYAAVASINGTHFFAHFYPESNSADIATVQATSETYPQALSLGRMAFPNRPFWVERVADIDGGQSVTTLVNVDENGNPTPTKYWKTFFGNMHPNV